MKNVMLLFLSEIHLNRESKLSFTSYEFNTTEKFDCVQTNESAVKYINRILQDKSEELDKIFLFSTNKTKEKIAIRDEKGEFVIKTHIECFTERIGEFNLKLANAIEVVDYDESSAINESIRQVTSMAVKLKAYMGQAKKANQHVVLHADMTGGFRHASMMMLSVMQLLKHDGIKIGKVIYSNYQQRKIEDVTEVHRMFDLVSGAEEFVNFGSVKMLERYFAKDTNEKSEELKALLIAMKDFSEAIKICRTKQIEFLLLTLGEKIEHFRKCSNKTIQEDLFAQMIETLDKEYGGIIKKGANRLDIIKWCIDKDFLQQAMTLYTEWIPLYLVETKILYPKSCYEKYVFNACKHSYKKREQVLITDYCISDKELHKLNPHYQCIKEKVKQKKPAEFLQPLREIFLQIKENSKVYFVKPFDTEVIKEKIEELKQVDKVVYELKDINIFNKEDFLRKYLHLYPILKEIYQNKKVNFKGTFIEYVMKKMSKINLFNELRIMKEEALHRLFEIEAPSQKWLDEYKRRVDEVEKISNSAQGIDDKWKIRERQLNKMLDGEILLSKYSKEKTLKIISDFHYIRNQRNQINHAYDGDEYEVSGEAIADKIIEFINNLKSSI